MTISSLSDQLKNMINENRPEEGIKRFLFPDGFTMEKIDYASSRRSRMILSL